MKPMTIRLTTNFLRREAGFGNFKIPSGVETVIDLLNHLGDLADFLFTDRKARHLRPDIELTLNQKDIAFYPKGLKTPLKDGDSVDINLTPLGGG